MMSEVGLVATVFIAIAIGWVLGKFSWEKIWLGFKNRTWRKSYMEGIHLLLTEESDQAIETFIQTWDVKADNFDLHNALANMLRRKGEVDRAIRIHASLVECEKLDKEQVRLATTELANDYIKAGLLDRAERLLINVVNNSSDFEERALELLQQLYQLERDWQKAIVVAEQLVPKRSVAFDETTLTSGKQSTEIAHYYCELAEQALNDDSFKASSKALDKALHFDPRCARAAIIRANIEFEKGQPKQAIVELQKLANLEPYLIVESMDLLQRCFADDEEGLISYLQQLQDHYPSSQIERTIYGLLKQHDINQAVEFLRERIKQRPTLASLDVLLEERQASTQDTDFEVHYLHQLVGDVLENNPSYQCRNCGFSGSHMHWHCPQCQNWDSIRRIRGCQGD